MLKKGITLVELLLAVTLLGFLIATVGVYGKYIGLIQQDVDKKAIVSMSKLGGGLEYTVQRILHSDSQSVDSDGKGVTFQVVYAGSKRMARIYFDKNTKQVLYDYDIKDNKPAKVFLTDIKNLTFTKETIVQGEDRLAIEIEAIHQPFPISLRTSLIGRNRPIPQGKIN